jgi:hypothetical protein
LVLGSRDFEEEKYMAVNYREIALKGKQARGKKEMLKHLDGGVLTAVQAIRAWCWDCTGFYDSGKVDCERNDCPLHPFMPYNPNRIKKRSNHPNGNTEGLKKWREAQTASDNESQANNDGEEYFEPDDEEQESEADLENTGVAS